jgi:hypothetical protein
MLPLLKKSFSYNVSPQNSRNHNDDAFGDAYGKGYSTPRKSESSQIKFPLANKDVYASFRRPKESLEKLRLVPENDFEETPLPLQFKSPPATERNS